jgi:hypothetical protein
MTTVGLGTNFIAAHATLDVSIFGSRSRLVNLITENMPDCPASSHYKETKDGDWEKRKVVRFEG